MYKYTQYSMAVYLTSYMLRVRHIVCRTSNKYKFNEIPLSKAVTDRF